MKKKNSRDNRSVTAVVFGYHNIGYSCLKTLLKRGVRVALVVTHEDDPREQIWFKSVSRLAARHRIPVITPDGPNVPEVVRRIEQAKPDVIFSFYYRCMISPEILRIPPMGAFNMHGSLLPAYRGRCPVNWVLVHGEKRTGVTIHHMTEKPDRGNVVAQKAVPIRQSDTALTLFNRITRAAPPVLEQFLRLMAGGRLEGKPQDQRKASYFGGRKPQDGRIDWNRSAQDVYNLVRAVTHPYPGAFTEKDGRKLFIWWGTPVRGKVSGIPGTVAGIRGGKVAVVTGGGTFIVHKASSEGGPEMKAGTVFKANGVAVGDRLGV